MPLFLMGLGTQLTPLPGPLIPEYAIKGRLQPPLLLQIILLVPIPLIKRLLKVTAVPQILLLDH